MRHGRGNLEPAQVGPLKPDPRVRRRGLQRERHLIAGMETNSGTGHRSTKSMLGAHDLSGDRWDSRPELSKRPATPQVLGTCSIKLLFISNLVTKFEGFRTTKMA